MSPDRRVWVKCRPQDVIWNVTVQNCSDTNWVKRFRMSRDTFMSLDNELIPAQASNRDVVPRYHHTYHKKRMTWQNVKRI